MKRFYLLFTFIVSIGIILGYLVLPSKLETGILYYQSGLYTDATKCFEEYQKNNPESLELIIPFAKSYFKQGKTKKSVKLLEKFIEKNPHSLKARKLLGTLYLNLEEPSNYLLNLKKISKLEPSNKTFNKLINLYSESENTKELYTVLIDKFNNDKTDFSEENYYKLIFYYASLNKVDNLNKVIKSYLTKLKTLDNQKIFNLILNSYYKQNEPLNAEKIAKRQIKNDLVNINNKVATITTILNYDPSEAQNLLYFLPEKDKNNPNVQLLELQIDIDLNKKEKAYSKAITIFQQGEKINPIFIEPICSIFLQNRDFNRLKELLYKVKINELSPAIIINIAIYSLFYKQNQIADYLQKNIDGELLRSDKALNSILKSAVKGLNPDKAITDLLSNHFVLTRNSRFLIADLLFESGDRVLSFKLVENFPVKELALTLSQDFIVDYAINYTNTNYFLHKLTELNKKYEYKVDRFIQSYIDISAASGNLKNLINSFKITKNKNNLTKYLLSSYFIAEQYSQSKAALLISKKLFALDKTDNNRKYYINSLIGNKDFSKAISIILSSREKEEYFNFFLEAYSGFLTENDISNINKYKPILEKQFKASLNSNLTKKQLANLGYVLADSGLKDMARDVFFKLSHNAPPESPYVKELIYLWGKRDWKQGLDWLTMRARNASKEEQLKWLKYLNETGNPKEVISILGGNIE